MHLGRSGEAYFVSDAPSDSGGASRRGDARWLLQEGAWSSLCSASWCGWKSAMKSQASFGSS